MKTKYMAPAVEFLKMEVEQVMAGQSGLTGNNQLGDGEQLSKEQDFFDDKAMIDQYIPDAFTNVFPKEEE